MECPSRLSRLLEERWSSILQPANVRRGRLRGLLLLDLVADIAGMPWRVASLAIFCGQPPYYRPWIEVYNIVPRITVERSIIEVLDSRIEDEALSILSGSLGPGESLYVEYYRDPETLAQLEAGVPVIATRLGYKLYKLGFTWFKVWYYPEGFYEGGQKLQAEKPVSEEARARHLTGHLEELRRFLERPQVESPLLRPALLRARRLLQRLSLSKHV
ncbi:MAG: DUF1122 family protein [Desulfurococcales archaeon]|nr:DUF1122 family protein [Desulfurococcales archaeon]